MGVSVSNPCCGQSELRLACWRLLEIHSKEYTSMLIHPRLKAGKDLPTLSFTLLTAWHFCLQCAPPPRRVPWRQEHEAAGLTGYPVRKQGEINPFCASKDYWAGKEADKLLASGSSCCALNNQSLREQAVSASLPVLQTSAMPRPPQAIHSPHGQDLQSWDSPKEAMLLCFLGGLLGCSSTTHCF